MEQEGCIHLLLLQWSCAGLLCLPAPSSKLVSQKGQMQLALPLHSGSATSPALRVGLSLRAEHKIPTHTATVTPKSCQVAKGNRNGHMKPQSALT